MIDGDESLFSYRFGDPSAFNADDSLGHTMLSVVINPFFDWGHDRPPGHEYHESVIYEMHVKGLTMTHPGVPEEIRGTYAGGRPPGDHRAPDLARRDRRRAAAGAPVRQRLAPGRPGPVELLGLQHDRLPRPAQRLRRSGRHGQQTTEFKAMVKALHEADIEVILDVVYNHTAEGNEKGPTIAFRGLDNASYYRLVDGDPAHYYDTTGTGNSLLMRSPHVLQLIMDSLRYWVLRDARRRVPLRPGGDPGPAVPRGRQAVGVLRHHPAGPGDQPGQADRRALGPRRRRLPGRQLPAAVDGVERQVPRHRPRLLARRAGLAGGVRLADHRVQRPVRALRPPPDRVDQLRHRPRRLHPARPGLVQREAQRGQRRGRQRRREPQPLLELRRRGRDRRPGDQRAAAAAAAQLHHHPDGEPGRADAGPRRRARPDAGRQQQRLRPGQRDRPGSTGTSTPTSRGCWTSPRRRSRCARRTRCCAGAGSSPATPSHGGQSELGDIEWLKPDGGEMDDRRLGRRLRRSR